MRRRDFLFGAAGAAVASSILGTVYGHALEQIACPPDIRIRGHGFEVGEFVSVISGGGPVVMYQITSVSSGTADLTPLFKGVE